MAASAIEKHKQRFLSGLVKRNPGEPSVAGLRISWSREEVDERLQSIMRDIHGRCVGHGSENGRVDYVKGANLADFLKVAAAMRADGVV